MIVYGALATPPAWWPAEDTGDHVRRILTDEMRGELRKWRTIAMNSAKAGRPYRDFASDILPGELHRAVTTALEDTMGRNVPERPAMVLLAFSKAIAVADQVAQS